MESAVSEPEVETDEPLEVPVDDVPAILYGIAEQAIHQAGDTGYESGYADGRESWQADVYEFHHKFGCHVGQEPSRPPMGVTDLRMNLIREECEAELLPALAAGDIPGIADAAADLIYVVLGTCVSYGIDLAPIWDAVHAANMAKEGGATREDGKILKPSGWRAPDVEGLLREQGWKG